MITDPRAKPVPPNWLQPIDDWTRALPAAGWSRSTIRTRSDHLRRAARALAERDPWTVTCDDLLDWCGRQTWSRETRRSMYASLRGFYRWAAQTGRCTEQPTSILPRVRPEVPHPRPLPEPLLVVALSTADERVRIILQMAAETGMRRAEIAQMAFRDLARDTSGWVLTVHGKGGRLREVPLTDDLALELRVRCTKNGGFLLPGNDHGHLSAQYVGKMASRVLPDGWALHTLRHRCATVVHDATGDLLVVQRILGHVSVATTQRYVQVKDDAMRRAIATAVTPKRRGPRGVAAA
jgi:integrase/recombinase XerC